MTKASVGDWSLTAASNTTVDGTNIDENCEASGINNAIRSVMSGVTGALTAVVTSGTDTYTATLSPAPDAYSTEMEYAIKFASANTSTTPTINLNALGAKTIVRQDGTALVAGDLNGEHILRYDGTDMRVLNPVTVGSANIGTSALADNAVTNVKLAQMAAHTFKGNNTASTANASDLTATQLTAELNAVVGDSGSGGTKGLVPAPGAGDAAAGKFLKADGTFAVPAPITTGTQLVVNPLAATGTLQTHGLGAVPTLIVSRLVCLTADAGYSVGDQFDLSSYAWDSTANGISVSADTSNVYFALSTGLAIPNKGSAVLTSITYANWKFVATPYKFG